MTSGTHLQQVAAVARNCTYRIWGFGEGPALLGLIASGDLAGSREPLEWVDANVRPWAHKPRLDLADHVASVEVLLELHAATGDAMYREAAGRWADLVLDAPRPVAGGPPTYRPDLAGLESMTWVDTMHTHGPGLALLGFPDEALRLVREACQSLQDDSGLFSHGFDVAAGTANGVHWGRGCGWALFGLLGTRAIVEDAELRARTDALLDALARHESDGRWHTVVDDPSSPVEHSVSAFVAAALADPSAAPLVDARFEALGERALDAAQTDLVDGCLPSSDATPVGAPQDYHSRSVGCFPWGQGPMLLALAHRAGWEPRTAMERNT